MHLQVAEGEEAGHVPSVTLVSRVKHWERRRRVPSLMRRLTTRLDSRLPSRMKEEPWGLTRHLGAAWRPGPVPASAAGGLLPVLVIGVGGAALGRHRRSVSYCHSTGPLRTRDGPALCATMAVMSSVDRAHTLRGGSRPSPGPPGSPAKFLTSPSAALRSPRCNGMV